jgi:hypothetical protein
MYLLQLGGRIGLTAQVLHQLELASMAGFKAF